MSTMIPAVQSTGRMVRAVGSHPMPTRHSKEPGRQSLATTQSDPKAQEQSDPTSSNQQRAGIDLSPYVEVSHYWPFVNDPLWKNTIKCDTKKCKGPEKSFDEEDSAGRWKHFDDHHLLLCRLGKRCRKKKQPGIGSVLKLHLHLQKHGIFHVQLEDWKTLLSRPPPTPKNAPVPMEPFDSALVEYFTGNLARAIEMNKARVEQYEQDLRDQRRERALRAHALELEEGSMPNLFRGNSPYMLPGQPGLWNGKGVRSASALPGPQQPMPYTPGPSAGKWQTRAVRATQLPAPSLPAPTPGQPGLWNNNRVDSASRGPQKSASHMPDPSTHGLEASNVRNNRSTAPLPQGTTRGQPGLWDGGASGPRTLPVGQPAPARPHYQPRSQDVRAQHPPTAVSFPFPVAGASRAAEVEIPQRRPRDLKEQLLSLYNRFMSGGSGGAQSFSLPGHVIVAINGLPNPPPELIQQPGPGAGTSSTLGGMVPAAFKTGRRVGRNKPLGRSPLGHQPMA